MTDRKISLKEVTTIDIDGRLLKDVIKDLTELLTEHGDTAQVSKEQYTYDEGWYLALLMPTPETDTEMLRRLSLEDKYRQDTERRERETYERLQAKFGTPK